MTKRRTTTAADFMTELEADPVYAARREDAERDQRQRMLDVAAATSPILAELQSVGCNVLSLQGLVRARKSLSSTAVSIILTWLPRLTNIAVQEQLVRILSAAPTSFPGEALVVLFESTQSDMLRWVVANTIAEARPTGISHWVEQAAINPKYGKAREMLMFAIARLLPAERANVLLVSLLEEFPLHCAQALAESGGWRELAALEERIPTAKGLVRKDLERAIRKIKRRL